MTVTLAEVVGSLMKDTIPLREEELKYVRFASSLEAMGGVKEEVFGALLNDIDPDNETNAEEDRIVNDVGSDWYKRFPEIKFSSLNILAALAASLSDKKYEYIESRVIGIAEALGEETGMLPRSSVMQLRRYRLNQSS